MIERVESFGSEFEIRAFRQVEHFSDGHVGGLLSGESENAGEGVQPTFTLTMTDGSTHPTILVWGQDDVLHYIDPTGKRQHGSIGTVAIFTTPLAGTLGSFTTLFHAIAVLAVEWLVLYWMYKRKIFLTAGAMPPRSGWSLLILAFLCGAVSGAWTATGEIVGAETVSRTAGD